MKELLHEYLSQKPAEHKLNSLREYLQWLVLKLLDDGGLRSSLAFIGGTALHLLYKSRRFSEDLDFSLVGSKKLDIKATAGRLEKQLRLHGFSVEIRKLKTEKTVGSFFIRFQELLKELDVSPDEKRPLSIKFEIDQNPPAGASVEEFLIQTPLMFSVNHYDVASLFSGKLHALLFRRFTKGRDFFDLLFYLGKETAPNLKLFQNAAAQTHPDERFPDRNAVYKRLHARIEKVNEDDILRDVKPFLLDQGDARFLTRKYLLKSLEQNRNLFL